MEILMNALLRGWLDVTNMKFMPTWSFMPVQSMPINVKCSAINLMLNKIILIQGLQ